MKKMGLMFFLLFPAVFLAGEAWAVRVPSEGYYQVAGEIEGPVKLLGVFLGKDQCVIIRRTVKQDCSAPELYGGDVVEAQGATLKQMKIRLNLFSYMEEEILQADPVQKRFKIYREKEKLPQKKSLLGIASTYLKDYFGSLRMEIKEGAIRSPEAGAGQAMETLIDPQSTLMRSQPVDFFFTISPGVPGGDQGKAAAMNAARLEIVTSRGEVVIDRSVREGEVVRLMSGKSGLEIDSRWTLSTNLWDKITNKVRFVDPDFERILLADFLELERQYPDINDRKIQKAAYAQIISDLLRDPIDLYWLSYQWMREMRIEELSPRQKDERDLLLKKYRAVKRESTAQGRGFHRP